MHEQAIAKDIIYEASKQGKVTSITVEVGDIAHLPLHELEEVLKTMTTWKVVMKKKRAKVHCTCGFIGEPVIMEKGHDHNIFKCPKCNALMPKVLEGKDIVLVNVEVE